MSSLNDPASGGNNGEHSSTNSPEPKPEGAEQPEATGQPLVTDMDHSPSDPIRPVEFSFKANPDPEAIKANPDTKAITADPDPANKSNQSGQTVQSPATQVLVVPSENTTSVVSREGNDSAQAPVPRVNDLFMEIALARGIDMTHQPPFTVTANRDGPCIMLSSHPVSTTDPVTGVTRACKHNQTMFAIPVLPQEFVARPPESQYSRGQEHQSRGRSIATRGQRPRGGSKRSSSSSGTARREFESDSTPTKKNRDSRGGKKKQSPRDDHHQYSKKYQGRRDDDEPGASGGYDRDYRSSRPSSNYHGSSRRDTSGRHSGSQRGKRPVSSGARDTPEDPEMNPEALEKDLAPLVVLVCEWDSGSLTVETVDGQVPGFLETMAYAKVFPEKVRELCEDTLAEHLVDRRGTCDTLEKRVSVFLLLISHLAIVANVEKEFTELVEQFTRLKEGGNPETPATPSEEYGSESTHDSDPDPEPDMDPLAEHYGYYYLPMRTPDDRSLLRAPEVHAAQLEVLMDMAVNYRSPVNPPSRPRAGNTYGTYFKTMTRPLPPVKRVSYNDVGYAKWQRECFTARQLTLDFSKPDIWSSHRRDLDIEFTEYMEDQWRPGNYRSVEEYIPAICGLIRYYREQREKTTREYSLVDSLRCQGEILPVESTYMVVFNPELQLHRGIDSRMYQFLGGPLFGFTNPVQFWATIHYILEGTNRDPEKYFWVLYYIGVNGNTVDDIAEAIRLSRTPEDLERYLQCQQTSKIHDPDCQNCPIHRDFNKKHPKVDCMRGIPWSSRMAYFDKYQICMGTQPGRQSQMCLTPHRQNHCGYGVGTKKPVPFCEACIDKRHMRPWCPRNAYDDGLYDQFVIVQNRQ